MPTSSKARVIAAAFAAAIVVSIGTYALLQYAFAPEEEKETTALVHEVIGMSVEGRAIEAYTYPPLSSSEDRQAGGEGKTRLLFVGGMHGGYEWNSVLLAYEFLDYLENNPGAIPDGMSVSVIPSANPDGVFDVVGVEGRFSRADVPAAALPEGTGRFNARDVDLNRNFDCKWEPESTWRNEVVSAGRSPFSEPEARAIRDFVLEHDPIAVIFWHSQADAVFASECEGGILPETLAIMQAYADAAGYRAVESFDAYEITGDAEGWLASIGIPAITVELSTHESVEWEKNLAGIEALFNMYSDLAR